MNPKPLDPAALKWLLAEMNISQLNAWNKKQRKGQARLKAWGYAKRAETSAVALRNEKDS